MLPLIEKSVANLYSNKLQSILIKNELENNASTNQNPNLKMTPNKLMAALASKDQTKN